MWKEAQSAAEADVMSAMIAANTIQPDISFCVWSWLFHVSCRASSQRSATVWWELQRLNWGSAAPQIRVSCQSELHHLLVSQTSAATSGPAQVQMSMTGIYKWGLHRAQFSTFSKYLYLRAAQTALPSFFFFCCRWHRFTPALFYASACKCVYLFMHKINDKHETAQMTSWQILWFEEMQSIKLWNLFFMDIQL